ncbi:MAG: TIGR00153 family protein [Desulfobacterales bacterium]|uniref:TIGR00153 family protein n=1 Tax=Candidatus Desulfatibia vada TaxID=2841696 RepID=A0A8J6P113_9BACT|nr:TIGR00153 family protein [Candidatus Desulfatibia vada]
MKTTNPLARLLRQSPFKPLQEHMRVVAKCVAEFMPLFEALFERDQNRVKEIAEKIDKIESEADAIKNGLRLNLPKTIFLPVARPDLLVLISEQDSIADSVENIAGILTVREMEVPEAMRALLMELIQATIDTFNKALKVIEELDELLEVGFRGKYSSIVTDMVVDLKQTEEITDDLAKELDRILFSLEDQLKPVSVILWYKLIKEIGEVANHSENVGDRILSFLAQ